MEKYFLYCFSFYLLILFNSCQQPEEEGNFPYEMKLVIRGILEPNKIIDSVYIGRTLPVGVPFDENFAQVSDAVGAIVSNGVFYTLRHTGNGIYTTDSLIAKVGRKYDLIVQWQGKSVSAETYIPVPGILLNSAVVKVNSPDSSYSVIECTIDPTQDNAYGVTWVLRYLGGQVIKESESFAEIVKSVSGEVIKVRSDPIPKNLVTRDNTLGAKIYIYDKAFYDFYKSQGINKSPTGFFGYPATTVRWNINGDGIGMFIGRIEKDINL